MAGSSIVDPTYRAAKESMAVAHRTGRRFLAVTGKAPGEMLLGILTSGLPALPDHVGVGLERGRVVYSAVLDARGKMISDLRVFSAFSDGPGGFLLDLPDAGFEGVTAHFRRFLPPRLAKVGDLSADLAMLTVAGPEAAPFLATEVLAGKVSQETLDLLSEGEEMVLASSSAGPIRVTRNADVNVRALDLLSSPSSLEAVKEAFLNAGAAALDGGTLEVLRIEKGRPAFGVDMNESTIPVEAGIHDRVIDHGKGCYIGQEVIIRIRDRGQVSKQLHGLLLGDVPVPSKGQEFFLPGKEKSVGWVTSACCSPAFGETIALGFLRREVRSGDSVRLGGEGGPLARVRSIGNEGWEVD
jgi:folate-binding protein YgfZ